jgi:hypothetical protein
MKLPATDPWREALTPFHPDSDKWKNDPRGKRPMTAELFHNVLWILSGFDKNVYWSLRRTGKMP